MNRKNIVLIGMPGAGKSTVGVLVAKALGMSFVDTDLLIQEQEQQLLQEMINHEGIKEFLKTEEEVILRLQIENSVIATGGSVICSVAAINHLQQYGTLIYLKLTLGEIKARIKNMASRGIVLEQGQTLADLYQARASVYEHYADRLVDCSGLDIENVVSKVIKSVHN
ncbi:MAG: shikimate kinase [Firmicutes bacterium]|nr:shikimate kinase [Bacillota bacterium]